MVLGRSFGCRWGGDPSLAGEGRDSFRFAVFFLVGPFRLVSMFDVGASFPKICWQTKNVGVLEKVRRWKKSVKD